LSQKKEIKRLEKAKEKEDKESLENQEVEEAEAKQRAVQDFERIQMGLEAKLGGKTSGQKIVGREDGKILVEEEVEGSKRGEKRKFELDEDELLRIARDERNKARKAIDDEKVHLPTALSGLPTSDNRLNRHPRQLFHHSGYHLSHRHQTRRPHCTTSPRKQSYPLSAQHLQQTSHTTIPYTT
jgi:hypothetical protein